MASLTKEELALVKNRRDAAIGTIKFFSKSLLGLKTHQGIKTIKSANNPFDGLSKAEKERFYRERDKYRGEKRSFDLYKYDASAKQHEDEDFIGYIYNDKLYDSDKGITPDCVMFAIVNYTYKDSLLGSIAQTMRTGMGNCDEKGKICFAALLGNPRLTDGKSVVSLVASNNTVLVKKQKIKRDSNGKKIRVEVEVEKDIGYDHVFVVVADVAVPDYFVKISSLGKTAMIVDGWTQDWYFPNLSVFEAMWHGLGNTPNPRQLVVRGNVKKNPTRNYGAPPDGVSKGQEVGVARFF